MRVSVIGAGVIGMTAAVAVKEAFPSAEVTIFADAFTPNTTGDGSAGLWGPYILSNTDPQKVLRWASLTHKWMESFWKSELASDVGVCLVPCYRIASDPNAVNEPVYCSIVHGPHKLTEDQIKKLSTRNKATYTAGWHFLTFTCEPARFLPWLCDRFKAMGGKVVKRKITDFGVLRDEGYDVIINCCGIGSRELVSDKKVVPVRGQVMRVKAPWIYDSILEEDDDGNYIIPNIDSVVLGGTHQENDFDCSVREKDSKFIHNGCQRLFPAIKKCEPVNEWVGLRPSRAEVRLEPEIIRSPGKNDLLLIHNYGHGGSGVTLCWGCALDVVDVLRQQQRIKNLSKL